MRPFIVRGDTTDHGGTVIEADATFDVHGKPVALVGHMVVCPKCKGIFPIKSGAPDMISMGMDVARHGDKTECGATLISSQAVARWSTAAGDGAPASAEATPAAVSPQTPTLCLECLATAAARGDSMVVRG